MKICFLSSVHAADDKRVFDKEALSLAEAGFDVVHIAAGDGTRMSQNGVETITHGATQSKLARLFKIPWLYCLAARQRADCYHCNEVESWLVGVLLKLTRRGKRVVFDVHEHFPSRFENAPMPRPLRALAAGAVRLLYRILTPFTDRLVFAKRSVAMDFKGSERKQVLVLNYTRTEFLRNRQQSEKTDGGAIRQAPATITAVHLGLIGRARGWPQLLDAVSDDRCKDIKLHFIGKFMSPDDDGPEFEARVAELELGSRIRFDEWMPFEQAFEELLAADIGLVLFQPGIQNHTLALPHKMFDYMMAGLPIIAPDFAEEVSAIIRDADCGVLVDVSDPDEVAAALERLANDARERTRLGQNGQKAVLDRYNWEAEAEKLIGMYRELAERIS